MLTIFMYLANGLIIIGFLLYGILILTNRKEKFTDSDGFNVTKDTLSEYGSINIVENRNILTIYNLKRKVIKIASKCYYGNSLSDISIPLMEAGVSAIHDKDDKYLKILSKCFTNLKKTYIIPLIIVFINANTFTLGDARIAIFLIIIASIISYMLISIRNNAYIWLNENIKNVDKQKVLKFINKIILCDKLIFFGELLIIIRFVAIILEII